MAIAAGMAYLPEERAENAVFPGMSVAANATLPWLRRFGVLGVFPNTNSELNQVSGLLARLDVRPLKGAARSKIRTFSGGNQQKVLIARWLMGAADIFLFDEPTQGIDVGAREQVYEVLRELAADGGDILIVSSEAEEPARLCSRVHIMRNGTIVQTLSGDEVTETIISRATMESGLEACVRSAMASWVRAPAFRGRALNLARPCSIGLRSGSSSAGRRGGLRRLGSRPARSFLCGIRGYRLP